MLTGLNTNWGSTYVNDRNQFLKEKENIYLLKGNLKYLKPYYDGSIAIGYGFDLIQNNNATINSFLTTANGQSTTLTTADIMLLEQARARVKAKTATETYLNYVASQLSISLISETAATTLLELKLSQYENALDAALGGHSQLADSKERIAVLSLLYSMVDPDSDKIAKKIPATIAAIKNDNRAEAWYEIRYRSNKDNDHTARRYEEADLFGLYDSGTLNPEQQIAQAKEIMRMYTIHELDEKDPSKKMSAYESNHGDKPDHTIAQEINLAKNYLINTFALGKTIDGEVKVGAGLDSYLYKEIGNLGGELKGTAKNDLLFGEKGDDVIIGGKGDDVLYGGEGNDTYKINAGDGTDTIEDKQGNNTIILCGKELNYFYALGTYFYNYDKTLKAEWQGSELIVTAVNNPDTKVILNENFAWGDFGIDEVTLPAAFSTPNPPITGDLTPILTAEGEYQYNQWGNVIVDADQPAPGRADALYDTSGDDLILGGGGDDHINTVHGGSDKIQGGSGNDLIAQKEGDIPGARGTLYNAIIEGGTGSDIILGHYTVSNQLFGDTYGEMSALITHGDEAPDNELKGDFISDYYLPEYGQSTSAGYLYGSDGRDILINNTGMGLMAGGAGNDLIYGDFDGDIAVYANNNTWDYTIDITTDESGDTTYTSSITGIAMTDTTADGAGSDDVIYAGTGNDFVLAGGGDDEVYGGTGDDTIFGEAGYDFIEGGDGDDILIGDNGDLLADSLSGGDYIDGGAGNDEIEGNAGDDELFGGADNDKISGDAGDDYLDGEAGADSLYGGAGADVIFGGGGDDLYFVDKAGENNVICLRNIIPFRQKFKHKKYQNTRRRFSQKENLRRAA